MAELKDGFVLSGRYKIISQTGVGGMGVVYKAQDLQKDRIVALKVLKDEFADKEEFVYRFRREAKAAINLKHPNIAMLYDVGSDNGIEYLVMEYVDNGTLADVLKKEGTLSVERTRLRSWQHSITPISTISSTGISSLRTSCWTKTTISRWWISA